MATKAPKVKTDAEIDADIKKAEERVETLRKQKYEAKLNAELANLRLEDLVKKIKEKLGKGLTDVVLLDAIGKAAGLKGFSVEKKKTESGKKGAGAPRKTYDDAFKAKAVKMVKDGKSKTDVCKELDITQSSLANWVKAANK